MSSIVIKVEDLGKQYRLGEVGTGTLSHDMNRWWAKIRGKQDPFSKIGDSNDRTSKGSSDYVWALKNIDFEVKSGQVLGIIGRNGAGKSTLLKILSKVTKPSSGKIYTKGRIASLLEVGTGFHPEMTGRENVFLNGAIMGMTRWEIRKKFDEIVDFAGVERYIDTPVKRYSSGMYVRLAFAVAAHLEPEILIVDEVLAVGDAEFQKKCLGKMQDVSLNDGRSVIFVSHNMAAVKTLCQKGLVLEHGTSRFNGDANAAITYYLKGESESFNKKTFGREFAASDYTLHEISLNPTSGTSDDPLDEYQEIQLNTIITIHGGADRLHFTYVLNNENGEALFTFSNVSSEIKLQNGKNHLKCIFPKGFLNVGTYYLSVYLIQDAKNSIFSEKDILAFDIQEGQREMGAWMGREPGFIKPVFAWENHT